jgi:hypothetical protein
MVLRQLSPSIFFEVDLCSVDGYFANLMRYSKFIAVGAFCAVLPSCGLVKSAARIPGGLMKAVGRTAGMNVNNDQPKMTELEKQEEEANKIY